MAKIPLMKRLERPKTFPCNKHSTPVLASSSPEAEFRSMAQGPCELMWLKSMLIEVGIINDSPMKLDFDNKTTISIAHNLVYHDRTKHIEVDKHFISEKLGGGLVCIPFIPTEKSN